MYVANYCDASGAGGECFKLVTFTYHPPADIKKKKKKKWYEIFCNRFGWGLVQVFNIHRWLPGTHNPEYDGFDICNYVC